jgi:predicted SprT family Zn-dependent metalloprotease
LENTESFICSSGYIPIFNYRTLIKIFSMDLQAAEALAHQLMDEFGLFPEWSFGWDRAKKRFGKCNLQKKEISLSRYLTRLNPREQVEDTIRHEIAHAKDAEERGCSDHSMHWKRWAVKCGAKPTRCYSSDLVNTPDAPYYTYCPNCETYSPRFRKMKKNRIYACGKCSDSFNPDYLVIPNIPHSAREKMDSGIITWHELPQVSGIAKTVRKYWVESLFVKKIQERT